MGVAGDEGGGDAPTPALVQAAASTYDKERDAQCITTPLHEAIAARDLEESVRLIKAGVVAMDRRNKKGLTPLMMACMHAPEIVAPLLEKGAGVTIRSRSTNKRSAEEYARMFHHHDVADRLKELAEAAAAADNSLRCGVCQSPAKRFPHMASLALKVSRGEEANPLVAQFFSEGEASSALCAPDFHRINDIRGMRKEITESMAAVNTLDRRLAELGLGPEDPVHCIDLCCGKSITTAFLSLTRPAWRVTAVDIVDEGTLPHYEAMPNAEYRRWNLLGGVKFFEQARSCLDEAGMGIAVVLGTHLCGRLSIKAVELFQELPTVRAIVLSPCCLPNKKDTIFPRSLFASRDPDVQYRTWAEYLSGVLEAGEVPSEVAAARKEHFDCAKGMTSLGKSFRAMAGREESGGGGGTLAEGAESGAGSKGGAEAGAGAAAAAAVVMEYVADITSLKRAVVSGVKR